VIKQILTMKPEQITETLEAAAEHLGIRVRYETMTGETAGGGGLCKLKGRWCVIMDRKTSPADRIALLVDALAGFDTDGVFLPPELREAVQAKRAQHRASEAPAPPPQAP
jgi:hypothetical protein